MDPVHKRTECPPPPMGLDLLEHISDFTSLIMRPLVRFDFISDLILGCISLKSVHSVLTHLAYKRSVRNSSRNAFLRCEVGQRILILKKSTFIASPMLEILSQTEINVVRNLKCWL